MQGCISDLGHPAVRAALCGDAGHCSDAVTHGCISDLGHPGVGAVQCRALHCSNAGLHFRSRTSRCRGSRRTCDTVHCIAVMHGCISDLGHPAVRVAQCGDAVHCIAVTQGCISDLGHPGVRAVQCRALQRSNAWLHFRSRTSRCQGSAVQRCSTVMHGCISDLGHPGVGAVGGHVMQCSDAVMHGCISDLGHPAVRAALCGDAGHCIALQ